MPRKSKAAKLREIYWACRSLATNMRIEVTAGACKQEPLQTVEYVIHELCHAVWLGLNLNTVEAQDINNGIGDLPKPSRDFNEAEAVATEFFVAKRLGVSISRKRLLCFSRQALQHEWRLKTWELFVRDREKEQRSYGEEGTFVVNAIRKEMDELRRWDEQEEIHMNTKATQTASKNVERLDETRFAYEEAAL